MTALWITVGVFVIGVVLGCAYWLWRSGALIWWWANRGDDDSGGWPE